MVCDILNILNLLIVAYICESFNDFGSEEELKDNQEGKHNNLYYFMSEFFIGGLYYIEEEPECLH